MSTVTDLRLKIIRRINLGNYEHVEIEASSGVSRDSDDDTPKKMRDQLIDEVNALLEDARAEHVPKRRQRYDES